MTDTQGNALVPHEPTGNTGVQLFRQSTDAAGLCKEIVLRTAKNIQGRKFVPVEGWQAIAIAHGCIASAGDVERTDTGFRAIAWIKRADTGQLISTAEGFVGDDEKTWASRAEYAKRAMAQTRAISRACRSAFAHVVVMMNAGLSTTPAEEMMGHVLHDDEPAQAKPLSAKALAAALKEFTDKAITEAQIAKQIGHDKPWTKDELNAAWSALVPDEATI